MSGNGNQVPLAPNQRGSISYPRASTPHRPVECYHPGNATGVTYMPSNAGAAQPTAQTSLRVQPTQPSAPPAPQQDLSKTSMAGHSYVSQNQSNQQRTQYPNFQYRTSQHTTRPTTHPRQQQPFMPGAGTSTGPVMYPLVFQPTPLNLQTYQQPRSSAPYYPSYLGYIPGYNTPPGHTPQYYYSSNSPQLPTPNPQTNAPGRSNPSTLVGQQGTTTAPTAPTASLPHSQPPTHLHQTMPGIPTTVAKRSHRLAIIDPATNQDILSDLYSTDSYVNNDTTDRQTPQPEQTHNIVEEFSRRVTEAAHQQSDSVTKRNYAPKHVDLPVSSTSSTIQQQPNPIIPHINNKSEILTSNESKTVGPDIVVETNETPIVSAISDSPVIVPKMPLNVKQYPKNCDQSLVIESNKSFTQNKQLKNKNVPQVEEADDAPETVTITTTSPSLNQVMSSTIPVSPYTQTSLAANLQAPIFNPLSAAQPQRVRESKEKIDRKQENVTVVAKERDCMRQAVGFAVISSVDSSCNAINPPTSQSHQILNAESTNSIPIKQTQSVIETGSIIEPKLEAIREQIDSTLIHPSTNVQLGTIEKVSKDKQLTENIEPHSKLEVSCVSEAQAKLTQSLSSVLRANQPESVMKDINLNNKSDSDTANGNNVDIATTDIIINDMIIEDINKNDKIIEHPTNNSSDKDACLKGTYSYENGNETDKVMDDLGEPSSPGENDSETSIVVTKSEDLNSSPVYVPKYKYGQDQWSPVNVSGKKAYGIGLLKQIKDDPMSKHKLDVPLLESCNVIRTVPMQESLHISNISRPTNDTFFPTFGKGSGMGPRNNTPRDTKKDGRNISTGGRGSMKMASPGGGSGHKSVIHVRLHDDVKLNEVDSAWKPTRFRQENMNDDELKTQELYKKFRGILNKLTPQKFDTLLDRIKTLEINNQKRLEGVIDLVFEKAIDEPNFSEAYAAMCSKLSKIKVPADNAPEQAVNFRALIINKCQNQFEADKVDENVIKMEKEVAECTDPVKKKELLLMLDEEQRKLRMRSVGNVRFIGELYKLKMLTSKIMDHCMKILIERLEEEKLECLCKLLTTIGEQIENEGSAQLDNIFKKMQEIVDRKSNKISSRVRFMIQDVIELRKRKWVTKSVIDSQPKMMDQIQKEAEQQQRHIELMNASPSGNFRRDDGGRGKRGDSRRQNSNNAFADNSWKTPRATTFPVDTSKLKAVTQKNLSNIKLAPQISGWNHGSGTKNTQTQTATSSNSMISSSKNKYSVLENVQADPSSLRGIRDMTPNYHSKGASIERSTFNSRGDYGNDNNRHGLVAAQHPNPGARSASTSLSTPTPAPEPASVLPEAVPSDPLPQDAVPVKTVVAKFLIHHENEEFAKDISNTYAPKYHAAVVGEIFNIMIDKSSKEFQLLAKSFEHIISTNVISADNFLSGMKESLEFCPDLFIDIPKIYENLGSVIATHIVKKHITFADIHKNSENILAANHGQLLLKAILKSMRDNVGSAFVNSAWQKSGMQLKQWIDENEIAKWMGDNNLEFLDEHSKVESKLLNLMKADESCDHIKAWVQEKIGKSSNEDWFMRSLIQAICEYALFGPDGRDMAHFNQDRMNKYASLIHEFGENKQTREASCLFGIQQLIHRLEHPQGLALVIFQYLHEQYIISLDGFIEWEKSEKDPEGKAVMLKMLTSFFTNIKEADNEDSCSED